MIIVEALSLGIKWTDVGADIIKFTPEILGTLTGIAIAFRKTRRKLMEAWFFSVKKWKDLVFFINLAKYVKELQVALPKIETSLADIKNQLERNGGKNFWHFLDNNFKVLNSEIIKLSARIKTNEDEEASVGIFECDTNLRWAIASKPICEWSKTDELRLINYGWKSIIHKDDIEFVERQTNYCINEVRHNTFKFRMTNGDMFQMSIMPTMDDDEKVIGVTGTLKKL